MSAEPANNSQCAKRADSNRERKLKARRTLDQLLAIATADDFCGSVTIEVSSQNGLLGRISRAYRGYE